MSHSNTTTEDLKRRRDLLFDSLSAESNRGMVLVAAAFIDHALELLLRARFSSSTRKSKKAIDPLFQGFGPLSTFSAKIKICFAIDLLQRWLFKDLEIIRKLRNSLAHSTAPARFDDPEIAGLTRILKGADYAVTVISDQQKSTTKSRPKRKQLASAALDLESQERLRFLMTVSYIGRMLYDKIVVQQSNWPEQLKSEFMASRNVNMDT